MKVEVALEESLTNKRHCYVVFNDTLELKKNQKGFMARISRLSWHSSEVS